MAMATEQPAQDQEQDQEQDQDAQKKQRKILIILGVVAVLGYTVMAVGMRRGNDGAPSPLPGGAAAQAWFSGLTGVDPRTITAAYDSHRAFRWEPGWRFNLNADEEIVLTIPSTTSRWIETRTLGLRLHPGTVGGKVRAKIVYELQDKNDPQGQSDLAPKLVGSRNALILPRKPSKDDQDPSASMASKMRAKTGAADKPSTPAAEDLNSGKMALLLAAGTVTITSTADETQMVEVF